KPASAHRRWRIAVIGAVTVLAAGIGLVLGLTVLPGRGSSPLGTSASYVPAQAVMYMEARLDLPAGQRGSLRIILERFPGIDADDLLTDALADTLDDALAGSNLPIDYSGDIAPWFDGRVAVALLDYPLSMDPTTTMELPSAAALVGVRDAAAAGAFTDRLRQELEAQAFGATFTSSEHSGVTIWTLEADAGTVGLSSNQELAFALTGDQLLLANGQDTIETLLDVHAGSASLAQRDELRDVSVHLPAEWVGVATIDVAAMLDQVRTGLESADPALRELMDVYLDAVPGFAVSTIGFQDDAVRIDGVSTLPSGDVAPSNSRRELAASVPGDAIFFADGANVGPGLTQSITALRAALAASEGSESALEGLRQAEAALGADLEEFVSWIGSGAMAAGWDGEQPYGGLVLEAADPAAAAQRLGQLRALVELAAMDPSTQVEVSTADVNGVEVTTIRVSTDATISGSLPVSKVVVQYALDGETAVIGFGDRFVGRALAIEAGQSLADTDRYAVAIDRFGGDDNAGAFFLDLVALREALETAVGDLDTSGVYEAQIKPNVEPLDYFAGVTRVEGAALISRYGLVLRP
ncbi:MAG TPA: DUF3352 domain-containing protein, partial [Candidatus Limnocylindrales bacterium]|nr:DUF3352 domain-containing protein [Candidatus Limnocylindrales bacterium]